MKSSVRLLFGYLGPAMICIGVVSTAYAQEDELTREIREFHIKHVSDKQVSVWQDGAKSGIVRYSIYRGGNEEVYDALFIQWIQEKPAKAVIASMRANLITGIFDSFKVTSAEPYTFRVAVGSIYCSGDQDYEIKLLGVGHYAVKYLNKDRCQDADTSGEYK